MAPYGIHWFRRDLRIAGNPALADNWKKNHGRVVGFFCFDPTFLSRPDFSTNRFRFFLETLRALKEELQEVGSDLLVLDGGPDEAFRALFHALADGPEGPCRLVTFNRDYEPFARARDERITRLLQSELNCGVWTEPDHLLIEPSEIEKADKPYQVYTPYQRKWLGYFRSEKIQNRLRHQKAGLEYLKKRAAGKKEKIFSLEWKALGKKGLPLPDRLAPYLEKVVSSVPLPKAGSLAAFHALEVFAGKVNAYADERDLPAVAGTSQLSIYFKNGSLTVSQAIAHLELEEFGKKALDGKAKYLSELIWREFYYYILFHFPHVEHKAFQSRWEKLKWPNNPAFFEAWKEGRTGFPLVDAGMRQLNTTGWMHNRVRMVVASFLTKDLLVDWRWGEKYFMEKLLDGDLAPNNGGWQWAASTGCDPQPYFRIFNPTLQSEKFDPKGDYIRKYVPELLYVPDSHIHEPEGVAAYPKPIVQHAVQREKALKLYAV
jgi:deoxyribodipyrimidine photo-lyase